MESFYDNIIAALYIKQMKLHFNDDVCFIPKKATFYINPIMSSKIYNNLRHNEILTDCPDSKLTDYATRASTMYKIHLKNVYNIDNPKELFTIDYKDVISSNLLQLQYHTLQFDVELDCVLNGFAGYYNIIFYGDIRLSNNYKSDGIDHIDTCSTSYFPISEPQQLKTGDELEVNFWQCTDTRRCRIWYEWSTSKPHISHIHNQNGQGSCFTYKSF